MLRRLEAMDGGALGLTVAAGAGENDPGRGGMRCGRGGPLGATERHRHRRGR